MPAIAKCHTVLLTEQIANICTNSIEIVFFISDKISINSVANSDFQLFYLSSNSKSDSTKKSCFSVLSLGNNNGYSFLSVYFKSVYIW